MHVPPKLAGSISEAICKQENQIGREPFTDFVRKIWWPQMVWRHSLHGRSYPENLQYKSHVCRSWDLFQGLIYLKTAFGCQPNHSSCSVHHLPMYLMIKYVIKIKIIGIYNKANSSKGHILKLYLFYQISLQNLSKGQLLVALFFDKASFVQIFRCKSVNSLEIREAASGQKSHFLKSGSHF